MRRGQLQVARVQWLGQSPAARLVFGVIVHFLHVLLVPMLAVQQHSLE